MIRYQDPPKPLAKPAVVHAAVVHAPKRKPGRYLDPDARRAYKAEWMRRRRAADHFNRPPLREAAA
jgi:hypothetical protein